MVRPHAIPCMIDPAATPVCSAGNGLPGCGRRPARGETYAWPLTAVRGTGGLCPGNPGIRTGALLARECAPAPSARHYRVRDRLPEYEQCHAWGYNLPRV